MWYEIVAMRYRQAVSIENSIIKQKSIARYTILPRGSAISNTSPLQKYSREKMKKKKKKKNIYFKTSQEDRLSNRSLEVAVCLKGFAGIQWGKVWKTKELY